MKITSISKLNAKIAITVAVAGAIISIAFVKSSPKKENAAITPKKKVERPLKNADVEYTSYKVDADAASVLSYKTGSEIKIPAGAFVDDKGKPVTGKVDLKYREFHDPADFFVSGIPMTYDSAGTEYHFESAGMLEILAYQDNKPVFVSPGKRIVVEMASKQPDDKYNIYQFDSLAGNWKFIYKDRAGAKENAVAVEAKPVEKPQPMPVTQLLMEPQQRDDLVKPKLQDANNYQFNLDLNLKEFPEIAVYKDLKFEVPEGTPDFDKAYASRMWSDVELQKSKSGIYLMTLTAANEIHTFEVNPVFDALSYKDAFSKYTTLLQKRKSSDALAKKKNDSLFAVLDKERNFQTEMVKNYLKYEAARMEKQNVIQRVFLIDGFGIWNSDCPAKLPQGEQFAASYVDSTGKKIDFKTLYLVEKGRNAMFSISGYSRLYYDPTKKNILWAVTTDNKLAFLSEERFKELKQKNDSCTVMMKVIGKNITKSYEVREALNL